MNPMKEIKVEKLTLNLGTGGAAEKVEKGAKLLTAITGEKPIKTTSMKRIPTWGVRPNLAIAVKVTLRGKKAEELLKRLFQAIDNKIQERKFDKFGNFSFGIDEYIKIPGVAYDVSIGIIGLEAAVTLQRSGFRIKRRSRRASKIPARHQINKTEAIQFVTSKFNVTTGESE